MLTVILAVSFFCNGMSVYAIQQQSKRQQRIKWINENMQEIAAVVDGKTDKIKRDRRVKEYKQLIKMKKQDQLKTTLRKRRLATAARIVTYANQFVGNPYVWGGNSLTNGCDCSHFVYNILKDVGVYKGGYTTSRNWAYLGKSIPSIEQAQAGDVIVYSGHVAIYDGKGKIIEAQSSSAGITNNRSAISSYIFAIRRFI